MVVSDQPRVFGGLVAGHMEHTGKKRDIINPYDRSVVGTVSMLSRTHVESAVAAASVSAEAARKMPAYERAEVLVRIRHGVAERAEELAQLLAREAGKPIKAARVELDRTLSVLKLGAEEATRMSGELLPLDSIPAGLEKWGMTRRFPLSVVGAITPFNFPLLLAAHKLAPAIACGATVVLKPPPQDPLTTLLLAEIVRTAGYPEGAINIVPCDVADAAPIIEDSRVKMISFTGSARAGWAIRAAASKKRIALELGGNAGVIVEADADLTHAASRCALGGFGYAGQSCISVQRIFVQNDVYGEFLDRLTEAVSALKYGDPLLDDTDVGPLIEEGAADRALSWIDEAVDAGATVVVGGGRHGPVVEPTVLTNTNHSMKVNCEEVFAPVVTVGAYQHFEDAISMVNNSPYGLQSGVFTNDIRKIWHAFEHLEVGGVIANDISTFRIDAMPYGGVKESGIGREGVRYAMEKMTEMRLLVV